MVGTIRHRFCHLRKKKYRKEETTETTPNVNNNKLADRIKFLLIATSEHKKQQQASTLEQNDDRVELSPKKELLNAMKFQFILSGAAHCDAF